LKSIAIICFLASISLIRLLIISLKITPSILYENGLLTIVDKYYFVFIKRKIFIQFENISKFKLDVEYGVKIDSLEQFNKWNITENSHYGEYGIRIKIVSKNNKKYLLDLDELDDLHLILNTFLDYLKNHKIGHANLNDYLEFGEV
jgi:hypothetical protein